MSLVLRIIDLNNDISDTNKIMHFTTEGGSIGRATSNDWVLADENQFISNRHANILFEDGEYYIVDNSTNGVFINFHEQALGKGNRYRLDIKDKIKIHRYIINVDAIESPSETPTQRRNRLKAKQTTKKKTSKANYDGDAFGRLLAALDLQLDYKAIPDLPEQLAEIIASLVNSHIKTLLTRSTLRNKLHAVMTTIKTSENNPLKFSINAKEALEKMLTDDNGYLDAQTAISESTSDINNHHDAIVEASKDYYKQQLMQFDPVNILSQSNRRSGFSKDGKNWRHYQAFYQAFLDEYSNIFTEEFAKAYEKAYAKLR